MHELAGSGATLAAINKHHLLGIIGFVVAALILVFGGIRVATHVLAGAMLIAVVGLAILVIAVLLYTHVI